MIPFKHISILKHKVQNNALYNSVYNSVSNEFNKVYFHNNQGVSLRESSAEDFYLMLELLDTIDNFKHLGDGISLKPTLTVNGCIDIVAHANTSLLMKLIKDIPSVQDCHVHLIMSTDTFRFNGCNKPATLNFSEQDDRVDICGGYVEIVLNNGKVFSFYQSQSELLNFEAELIHKVFGGINVFISPMARADSLQSNLLSYAIRTIAKDSGLEEICPSKLLLWLVHLHINAINNHNELVRLNTLGYLEHIKPTIYPVALNQNNVTYLNTQNKPALFDSSVKSEHKNKGTVYSLVRSIKKW